MLSIQRRIAILFVGLACCACSGADSEQESEQEQEATIVDSLVAAGVMGLVHSALPPFYSHCGEVQPGFDPDNYDPVNDTFCTITETKEYRKEQGEVLLTVNYYVTDMGTPDPEAQVAPWMHPDTFYCNWTMSIKAEPFDSVPPKDAQWLTSTVREVSYYCSEEYVGAGAIQVGQTFKELAMRSTDPNVLLFTSDFAIASNGGNSLFMGFAGMDDTGGSPRSDLSGGGGTELFDVCTPTPAKVPPPATSGGPGICEPVCRLFMAADPLPLCSWDNIPHQLPDNPDLIDNEWKERFSKLYKEIHPGK